MVTADVAFEVCFPYLTARYPKRLGNLPDVNGEIEMHQRADVDRFASSLLPLAYAIVASENQTTALKQRCKFENQQLHTSFATVM